MKEKIFCIGLSRTGTTSLSKALKILGYRTIHLPGFLYFPHFFIQLRSKYLENYDAFSDISVIPFYKKLDRKYENAKFIYTTRDKKQWLKSCAAYPRFRWPIHKIPIKLIALRYRIYGTINFDRNRFSETYDKHHDDVIQYFDKKDDKFLAIDITEGDKWRKLCDFLDKPLPEKSFPDMNKRKNPMV